MTCRAFGFVFGKIVEHCNVLFGHWSTLNFPLCAAGGIFICASDYLHDVGGVVKMAHETR